jgi:chromosomal replication initiator protein
MEALARLEANAVKPTATSDAEPAPKPPAIPPEVREATAHAAREAARRERQLEAAASLAREASRQLADVKGEVQSMRAQMDAFAKAVLANDGAADDAVKAKPTLRIIAQACADAGGITHQDIISARRMKDLVLWRQAGMYLCREMTPLSLPKIGSAFGGRDHSTVCHAVQKIEGLLATEDERTVGVISACKLHIAAALRVENERRAALLGHAPQ